MRRYFLSIPIIAGCSSGALITIAAFDSHGSFWLYIALAWGCFAGLLVATINQLLRPKTEED